MPSEKETFVLKSKDYRIKGNELRAFYDKHGKLVFVLDLTVNELKPNVLLVMASHGDRKWDDVLTNDYGMDLELVRPKKDNKYQKLDIEYDGLVVYDNLIQVYKDGGNIDDALKDLKAFRAASVRRSASERLAASTAIAENARETIERTSDVIVELQAKIKSVRSKITSLRRAVGKEPTKQSAAKILKAEAQLDVLTGKLARAKKRLGNANKRLLVAEDDIAAARKVLDLVPDVKGNIKKLKSNAVAPVVVPVKDDDTEDTDNDETTEEPNEFDDEEVYNETVDEDNNSVKPLFDKDPNILDDKIAFKPISFDENITQVEEKPTEPVEIQKETEDKSVVDTAPVMSFTPPKAIMDVVSVPGDTDDEDVKLDDIFSEEIESQEKYDTHKSGTDVQEEVAESAPVLDSLQSIDTNTAGVVEKDEKMTEIVAPENAEGSLVNDIEIQDGQSATAVPALGISENNTENIVRPTSPVRPPRVIGANTSNVESHQHRPSLLYYVLLLVLIALSVFTLWLYQRSNVSVDAVPELIATENARTAQVSQSAQDVEPVKVAITSSDENENPFVASAGTDEQTGEPVTTKIMEESLNKIVKAADVQPITDNADDEDFTEDSAEVVSEPATPIVNKPEYNVTQEKVFTTDEPDVVGSSLCDDGSAPDVHGCCAGETYTDMGDSGFNCCPDNGGDCFPPMF